MHAVTLQNVAARNEHFVCAFVDVNVVSGNDVFDIRFYKPTPFCSPKFNILNAKILMTFRRFRCNFHLESGKMQE